MPVPWNAPLCDGMHVLCFHGAAQVSLRDRLGGLHVEVTENWYVGYSGAPQCGPPEMRTVESLSVDPLK